LHIEVDHQKQHGEITSGALQVMYSGALGPKKVEDLHEIAWGLGLKEEGVKEDYIKAIKDYLNAHPELRDNEQWAGLFDCGQQCRAGPEINNENLPSSLPLQQYQPPSATPSAHAHYLNPPTT